MKTSKLILSIQLLIAVAIGVSQLSANQESKALVPLPSVPDFTDGDGWGVALGLTVEYETAYDGSDEFEFEFDPAGGVHWRKGNNLIFWEGMSLGWRGVFSDEWLVQAGIRREGGLEPDDSEDGHLEGFEKRDSHIAGFLEARKAIGEDWRNWVGFFVLAGADDFGALGVLAAGHRFGKQTDGTGSEIYAFTTFATDDFITKDFGVTEADSLATGLPQTELGSGYRSVGLTFVDRRYLTKNIQLVSQAGAELYSSDIKDSPIARQDYELEVGVSLLWVF